MTKRAKRLLITIVTIVSVLAIVGVSYAYFTTSSQIQRQEATLQSGTMALTFSDNDNGISAKLAFGETVTKKFRIENTGTLQASMSIDWVDLVNTYTNGSLTYRLTRSETEDGTYEEIIPKTNVPVSSTPLKQMMDSEISVPAGETYYYNLEVTLNNLKDVDQTADTTARFSSYFGAGQIAKYRYYNLQVNSNGGVWETFSSTQEYLLKNNETKTIADPTRKGYTFTGWEVTGRGSTLEGETFSMGLEDTTITAQWKVNTYTVTIDGEDNEVEYGESIELGEPTREGYTFTHWTVTGGTLNGNTLTVTDDRDITVTPNFVINKYKYIVYHNQMNTNGVNYTRVEADTDEGEADYNTSVTPDTNTYRGFTTPEATTLTIRHETAYPPVLNKVEYNYTRNRYDLTIEANGGNYTGESTSKMYYQATTTLTPPSKTGYNFTNWTATTGTINGNEFAMSDSNATVTANYEPKTFSVTFNANGGTTTTASKTVTYDSTYGELPTPTYSGYEFLGWFTSGDGGRQVKATDTVSLSSNQILFAHWIKNGPAEVTLAALKATSNGVQTTSFANAATTAEGIFEMEDDYGTSYYYRGAVENNYVKFAGFFWRIIRINGDGSLRILYDGTSGYANGTDNTGRVALTGVAWNPTYNDAKYVGYMFGGANGTASTSKAQAQTNQTDTNIKTKLDEWYKTNIANKGYGGAVADAIFCNDRSTPNSSYATGYGTNKTNFGARERVGPGTTNPTPSFKCAEKNNAFTVNDTEKGNGALKYPVGLITADEISAAGSGPYDTANQKYYLYKGTLYWSFSSYNMYNGYASVFSVDSNGDLYSIIVYNNCAIVPVINLSAEYASTLVGDGTMDNPYQSR